MENSLQNLFFVFILFGYMCSVVEHSIGNTKWWEPFVLGAIMPIYSLLKLCIYFCIAAVVLFVLGGIGTGIKLLFQFLLSRFL